MSSVLSRYARSCSPIVHLKTIFWWEKTAQKPNYLMGVVICSDDNTRVRCDSGNSDTNATCCNDESNQFQLGGDWNSLRLIDSSASSASISSSTTGSSNPSSSLSPSSSSPSTNPAFSTTNPTDKENHITNWNDCWCRNWECCGFADGGFDNICIRAQTEEG